MADSDPLDERLWEPGWQGHTLAQRRRLARLSFIEKLRWLESAQRLVEHLKRGSPNDVGGREPPDR